MILRMPRGSKVYGRYWAYVKRTWPSALQYDLRPYGVGSAVCGCREGSYVTFSTIGDDQWAMRQLRRRAGRERHRWSC